ncbi:PREDICTED: uncharacterized protein LOC106746676 [Dinoponera quadriceps]|uniref:Odorant receptor n=1 Tax=Dinoponera quadriceps TaxID=609295 RepID=A0A6P3XKN0_DINQU|nr:PREDICTED: uncharacterized protein LOC106746676 [Dinoponera quadriceps]
MELQRPLRGQTHFGARGDMICVKSLQLEFNRVLLLAVGLWPYERSKFVRVQLILLYSILITSIIFQITEELLTGVNLEKCISPLLFLIANYVLMFLATYIAQQVKDHSNLIYITAYNFPWYITPLHVQRTILFILQKGTNPFSINLFGLVMGSLEGFSRIKLTMEILQSTYDELTDDSEIAIIEKYGTTAKRYTCVLTLLVSLSISVFTFLPFWPRFLDVVWPANESRPYPPLQITMEYFSDQETYFYLFALHTSVIFCIGETTLLATGAIIIAYVQYVCGMFRVASYRMEQAMVGTLKMSDTKYKSLVHKKIIYAIDMHRRALKLASYDACAANKIYFSCIYHGFSTGCDIERSITSTLFLLSHYVYVFVSNLNAQQITDHNEHVFATVYNIQWYTAPLQIQRIILFLLQRGTKMFYINLVGLFVGSMEGFTTLTSASISYFTVVYATNR